MTHRSVNKTSTFTTRSQQGKPLGETTNNMLWQHTMCVTDLNFFTFRWNELHVDNLLWQIALWDRTESGKVNTQVLRETRTLHFLQEIPICTMLKMDVVDPNVMGGGVHDDYNSTF